MVHRVEAILLTSSFYEKQKNSTLNQVCLSLVSPLCRLIGFGDSEINELHSVFFIYEECTRRNKNKMSCQGCGETTSDLEIFKSDDVTITLLIISNKINYIFSLSLCIHHIVVALRVGIICLVPIQWFCMKEESLS